MDHSNYGELDWVLVVAPYRKDAAYIEMLLVEHGMVVRTCADTDDLVQKLPQSPGVIITTHESLNPPTIEAIADHLTTQPNWSDLPIFVLLDRSAQQSRIRAELDRLWPRSRQLFFQRPVASLELVSGIQSALLVRLRQREVRDSIERERELRFELNHRVKNILASVTSIFRMTRRGSDTIDALTADFEGRLSALANVHSAVFEAGGDAVALRDIINFTLEPYRADGTNRFYVEGPDLMLTRDAGTTLALCLHELVTNAIKYGALLTPEGRVSVVWEISATDTPTVTLEWAETGGPVVAPPTRAGYGTRYVRAALAGVFGEKPLVTFDPAGLRCVVSGPLSKVSPRD
ncbi:sensor histidine kinase [Phyllobacterium bourgognense]|uniref:histidine kinase n=1 Tax=Phyllobacterium bourgognense TaxID=314236 RepID=A0A368YJJ8_9HYPH|nr:sensor histidine kinase [Phyllobacterium bourgognense]RCW78334.1 two-component sensor histidine kinase [Phyllobacterium bourgognense]